jgi:hypothetical protein
MAKRRKRPHNLIPREAVVHMNLRLPKSLYRELKRAAKSGHRSLHAEHLLRLRSNGDDVDCKWEWMRQHIMLIWERLNGEQAAEGRPATQAWPPLQERQLEAQQ